MKETIQKIRDNLQSLRQYGSPLYVYDYDVLRNRCDQLNDFKKDLEKDLNGIKVNIHYSPKANGNPAIVKAVKEAGLLIDAMSPLELFIDKKCGFNNSEIVYVCNNVDEDEMKMIFESGTLVCLDSISQVETWGKNFPKTNIMVRINPGVGGIGHSEKVVTAGKVNKFGICENNIPELLEIVKKYDLKILGVHQHLGSLFLDDKVEDYISGIRAGLEITKKHFKDVQIIDLGGGFGVPYKKSEKPLDLENVASKLKNELVKFLNDYPSVKEFKFEVGRFIPCEAGVLVGKVNAIKHENGTNWICTDIGMNELVRPSMYDAYHEISLLDEKDTEEITANICGNVCEGGDILGKDRKLKTPSVGDLILVHNAGAYGYSMASNYTGRPRPAEVMLYDDRIELIRKRDTLTYMEENLVW